MLWRQPRGDRAAARAWVAGAQHALPWEHPPHAHHHHPALVAGCHREDPALAELQRRTRHRLGLLQPEQHQLHPPPLLKPQHHPPGPGAARGLRRGFLAGSAPHHPLRLPHRRHPQPPRLRPGQYHPPRMPAARHPHLPDPCRSHRRQRLPHRLPGLLPLHQRAPAHPRRSRLPRLPLTLALFPRPHQRHHRHLHQLSHLAPHPRGAESPVGAAGGKRCSVDSAAMMERQAEEASPQTGPAVDHDPWLTQTALQLEFRSIGETRSQQRLRPLAPTQQACLVRQLLRLCDPFYPALLKIHRSCSMPTLPARHFEQFASAPPSTRPL
mmetsp:Transcript_53896/g.128356  ORF Transcript_53896/g.128356 Transcript_53896/m.128356 type:complete len:325 (-) Transcript_53896:23-997(-)